MLDVSNVNSRRFSMPFQASGRGPLKFAEYTMKFVIFVVVPQEAGNFPVSLGVPPLVSSYEKLDSWLKLLHELGRPKFGLLCRVLLDPKRLQKPMQLRYSVLLQLVRRKLQEAPSEQKLSNSQSSHSIICTTGYSCPIAAHTERLIPAKSCRPIFSLQQNFRVRLGCRDVVQSYQPH